MTAPFRPGALAGAVTVVTGASRGAGRAIAVVLGQAGAIVYVTGRTSRETPSAEALPGTIDETAALVTAAGGRGHAVRVDHTREPDVEALFDRVRRDEGRLDLLVNNAWGGYEHHDVASFNAPFWEQPLSRWETMFTAGVRATLLASRLGVGLMLPAGRGLIVNTVAWAFGEYLGNLFYDTAKAASIRMTLGMARELANSGLSVVALAPGFMRTERVMAAHQAQPFPLDGTESPDYLGRAVVSLALDPGVAGKSGEVLAVGDLAREYGFTDVDGSQPPPFRLPPAS
jgi:NAD(P)-dependent dehydrogenase (short-subunit alcohol dehydrogenase family)